MFTFDRNGISSNYSPKVTYQLSKNITGQLIYVAGIKSRLKTIIEYGNDDIRLTGACQLSVRNTYISCKVTRKFTMIDAYLHTSVKYGYLGFLFDYGINKKISEFSNVTASMIIGNTIGVCLNIRFENIF